VAHINGIPVSPMASFRAEANSKFGNSFEIQWNEHESNTYSLSDLKYFETDLTKGEHKIRVEYLARAWVDTRDWLNEYSFVYSLSPAKNWKSFGNLEITLNATNFGKPLTTNLGAPTTGKLETIAIWNFDKLPSDYFEIVYKPKMSSTTESLIDLGPLGFMTIFGLIISFLHFVTIKKYRKNEPTGKSWVAIAGGIVNPFLILISYMLSFVVIASSIGQDAGSSQGYSSFYIILLYPLAMPVYLSIMLYIDSKYKTE
jgi:hypothetical protein